MLAAEQCSFATGKNEAKYSTKYPAATLLHKRTTYRSLEKV
jgi:hypothetical protein